MDLPRCALLWRFGPQDEAYPRLADVARKFLVTLRCLRDGDLAARVGDLCRGEPGPAFAPLLYLPTPPALIVSGLAHNTGELGLFLDGVRAAGADFPLRAMVTETSAEWTLLQLLRQLEAESAALSGPKLPNV